MSRTDKDNRNEESEEPAEEENRESVVAEQNVVKGESTSPDEYDEEITWFLVGSGVFLTLILLIRRPKRFVDWLIPLSLIGAGLFFLYRQGEILLQKRQARMRAAQQVILAELDALDPVARAQVLKAVTEAQLNISTAED